MRIAILHNLDFTHLPEGTARRSQDSVLTVVSAVEQALKARAQVRVVSVTSDPVSFAPEFIKDRPDVVVNLCESLAGDARGEMVVPALLDLLGIPYTGSGPLALAMSLHKAKAKELLRAHGLATPQHALVTHPGEVRHLTVPLPAIVKPAREDASIGIHKTSVVYDARSLLRACERVLLEHDQPALVEHFIDGREINVALLGDPARVLPPAEIDFTALPPDHPHVVTYAAKWDESSPEFHATPPRPAKLTPAESTRITACALAAFQALDCLDYARVDLRLDADSIPWVLEVNPNCDLSPDSGFSRAALASGVSWPDLIWRLVNLAMDRHEREASGSARSRGALGSARMDRGLRTRRRPVRTGAGRPRPG